MEMSDWSKATHSLAWRLYSVMRMCSALPLLFKIKRLCFSESLFANCDQISSPQSDHTLRCGHLSIHFWYLLKIIKKKYFCNLMRTEKWASDRSMLRKLAKNLTLHGFFLSSDFSIKFLVISRDVWGPALNWCGEPMYMYLPKGEKFVWSKKGFVP